MRGGERLEGPGPLLEVRHSGVTLHLAWFNLVV